MEVQTRFYMYISNATQFIFIPLIRWIDVYNNTDCDFPREFGLSLNKRDVLDGEDSTLAQFGLVSGDLLHVIGPPLRPDEVNEVKDMSSNSSSQRSSGSDRGQPSRASTSDSAVILTAENSGSTASMFTAQQSEPTSLQTSEMVSNCVFFFIWALICF